MNILSYNVNGFRSALKKGFWNWNGRFAYDVIAIQEVRALEDDLPTEDWSSQGYNFKIFSANKKGYSGVALLWKKDITAEVINGMDDDFADSEGRVQYLKFADMVIINAYFPSGTSPGRQAEKMRFLDVFYRFLKSIQETHDKIVILGDFNIAHQPADIHDPKRLAKTPGFLPEERAWLDQLSNDGFHDAFRCLNPEASEVYSWWSMRSNAKENNKGWRIDYAWLSSLITDNLLEVKYFNELNYSDHCPLHLKFEFG